jgi:hypothetical protein
LSSPAPPGDDAAMDFDRVMADLFADEDRARDMAQHLMRLARTDPAAAAHERTSLAAFIRGPMEGHMAYEEREIFPLLLEHGLGPEVDVAKKQHVALREAADDLERGGSPEQVAEAVFVAARLMLHHTNFEGDYIYPELTRDEWHALMSQTAGRAESRG